MAQSTRSVSSDRTIRPSDSSSLSISATDLSSEEKSTPSSSSSLDYTSRSSSPVLGNHQPKPQNKEKYSLYPTLPKKTSNKHCHRHQDRQNQAEKRRSDKTIVDVIESYVCETDISHKQMKRCAGAAAGITAASKKPSTIKIVNVSASDVTFSSTGQLTPPPSDDDTNARDGLRNWKANPRNGPLPELAGSPAAYLGKPQWQPKPPSNSENLLPMYNYPSIKVTEKNGIKVRRYPMRKDSLESKFVSGPLPPLSSPLSAKPPPPPPTVEKPQQSAPQRYMSYSPLATNTSSFNAIDYKYHNDYQGQPINISPASTCPPSYTTATKRPATPLDPVTPRSAVWRASRNLQQHVSVWEDYDDDDDDDGADLDSEGERKGLIGRVKGRMSKGSVFVKKCALHGESDGKEEKKKKKKKEKESNGGNSAKEREKRRFSEPKRRFGRWGCGYF